MRHYYGGIGDFFSDTEKALSQGAIVHLQQVEHMKASSPIYCYSH